MPYEFLQEHVQYFVFDSSGEIQRLKGPTELYAFLHEEFKSNKHTHLMACANLIGDQPELITYSTKTYSFESYEYDYTAYAKALLAEANRFTQQFSGVFMLLISAIQLGDCENFINVIANPSIHHHYWAFHALLEMEQNALVTLIYETLLSLLFLKLVEAKNAGLIALNALNNPSCLSSVYAMNMLPTVYYNHVKHCRLSIHVLMSLKKAFEQRFPQLTIPDFGFLTDYHSSVCYARVLEDIAKCFNSDEEIVLYYCSTKINTALRRNLMQYSAAGEILDVIKADLSYHALFKELCAIYFDLKDEEDRYGFLIDEFKLLVFDRDSRKILRWNPNCCASNLKTIRFLHEYRQLDLPTLSLLINREPHQPAKNAHPYLGLRALPPYLATFFTEQTVDQGLRLDNHPLLKAVLLGYQDTISSSEMHAICVQICTGLKFQNISLEKAQRFFDALELRLLSCKERVFEFFVTERNLEIRKPMEIQFIDPADLIKSIPVLNVNVVDTFITRAFESDEESNTVFDEPVPLYAQVAKRISRPVSPVSLENYRSLLVDEFAQTYRALFHEEVSSALLYKDRPLTVERICLIAHSPSYLSCAQVMTRQVLRRINRAPLMDYSQEVICKVLERAVEDRRLTMTFPRTV